MSSTACDFVQKVADSTLAVFRPGSTHPAAMLFDALDQFDKKSPKADESIRAIRPDLANAVDTCVEAAGREPEAHWQKRLLRASYLKSPLIQANARLLNLDVHLWTCTTQVTLSRWLRRSRC